MDITHFPVPLTDTTRARLAADITDVIVRRLGADPDAVSVALEAVDPENWHERVVAREITGREHRLVKIPGYLAPQAPPAPGT
ncbi:tautomerase family protein [Streptomyces sp. BI20]|uniref:tautomerase family protein n=1 Tax=Streptomyces sp. BI20 TaxID=3403460 RepID=UPI003C77E071